MIKTVYIYIYIRKYFVVYLNCNMGKFCRRIAVVLKVLKNLVLFSGGRLSGQLRIQAGFNELEGMIRKRKGQIDQVSQNLIMAMKGKQYYPIQSIVHFLIFHLGIKPFVKKKGALYQGVRERWSKLGIA